MNKAMQSISEAGDAAEAESQPPPAVQKRFSLSAYTVLGLLGILGGVSGLFAGMICVIIHLILLPEQTFDRVGTVLLIMAIPMLLAGSLCMGELEK
jgi:hypothetical protein